MNKKQHVAELRAKAAKYRVIARQTADQEAAAQIFTLTAELEQQIRDLEKPK
jgi:hypothetical protein